MFSFEARWPGANHDAYYIKVFYFNVILCKDGLDYGLKKMQNIECENMNLAPSSKKLKITCHFNERSRSYRKFTDIAYYMRKNTQWLITVFITEVGT